MDLLSTRAGLGTGNGCQFAPTQALSAIVEAIRKRALRNQTSTLPCCYAVVGDFASGGRASPPGGSGGPNVPKIAKLCSPVSRPAASAFHLSFPDFEPSISGSVAAL